MKAKETVQYNEKETARRSVALGASEKQSLKKFVRQFRTITEAAIALGVSRQVLNRIRIVGSGSPNNIILIREKLQQAS